LPLYLFNYLKWFVIVSLHWNSYVLCIIAIIRDYADKTTHTHTHITAMTEPIIYIPRLIIAWKNIKLMFFFLSFWCIDVIINKLFWCIFNWKTLHITLPNTSICFYMWSLKSIYVLVLGISHTLTYENNCFIS
jgi:hypothetical protein